MSARPLPTETFHNQLCRTLLHLDGHLDDHTGYNPTGNWEVISTSYCGHLYEVNDTIGSQLRAHGTPPEAPP